MTAKSHVLTSLVVVLAPIAYQPNIFNTQNIDFIAMFLASVIAGSLFPDIDEENSYIGSRFKIISKPLNIAIGHRTYTHNLLLYLPLLAYAYYQSNTLLLGFLIGAVLHVLEDAITNSGVKGGLSPLAKKLTLLPRALRFQTNGFFETFIYLPIITILIFIEIYFISSEVIQLELFL